MSRMKLMYGTRGARTFFRVASVVVVWATLFVGAVTAYAQYEISGDNFKKTLTALDPISMGDGVYTGQWRLLDLGGPMDLHFTLYYNPNMAVNAPGSDTKWLFPPTNYPLFTSNLIIRLSVGSEWGTGKKVVFGLIGNQPFRFKENDSGVLETVAADQLELKESNGYYYLVDHETDLIYIFETHGDKNQYGVAKYIVDRNGNRLTFTYNTDFLPAKVEDNLGRVINLSYNVNGDLISIRDRQARTWRFNYAQVTCSGSQNSETYLGGFTDPAGKTTTFEYDTQHPDDWSKVCYFIKKVNLPKGNSHIDQTWYPTNPNGVYAVHTQTDAYGNTNEINWDRNGDGNTDRDDEGNLYTTIVNPDGTKRSFSHYWESVPKKVTDETGKNILFGLDEKKRTVSVTDRLGHKTNITYDAATPNKIKTITDPDGHTTTYTYTPQTQTINNPDGGSVQITFYNLTRVDYPDGTRETFEYDGKGNITKRTDRAGNTWNYEYDAHGWLTKVTYPTGGWVQYQYNADGTVSKRTTSDGEEDTYAYDTKKRLTKVTHKDGTHIDITYDDLDRVTSITDEKGVTTNLTYDDNGNLEKVDQAVATGVARSHQYDYDGMDRVEKYTDPLGNQYQFSYTYWGAVRKLTFPDNNEINFSYDPRRWLQRVTDEAGNTLTISHNDEGIITGVTLPTGSGYQFDVNKEGFITKITDPAGKSYQITRNAWQRITQVKDRLGRTTTITRDGEGRIIQVDLPVIGTVKYERDGLGNVVKVTDPRGKVWNFTYTGLGKLQSMTDPNRNTWQYAYDNRGRLQTITYPDGTTETRTYDAVGNLLKRHFSNGLDISFTYDELNRITHTASEPVDVSYDKNDRVTQTQMGGAQFDATYNARGNLATATYNGAMTVTYTYDARGLLTQVQDSMTHSWVKFTYNGDRRLTKIERSNGVTTTFDRDANGRITKITHGTKGELTYTYNAEGDITQLVSDLPASVAQWLASGVENLTYDDANQINAQGFEYDARGRRTKDPERTYSWDAADRLIGVTMGTTTVTYTYTALGEVVKRTVNSGGQTLNVEYFYNYAIKDHPIVAEKENGNFVRFYVYTPGGRLLYYVDVPNTKAYFYHFDRKGSTLFLTDSNGNITDSYGYTPYGRMVTHNGNSPQPFTYVGEHGVRQEGETGLYHMRARYYDSLTGRFISRDPVWMSIFVKRPQEVNPYQYAYQNPVRFIDPLGTQGENPFKEPIEKLKETGGEEDPIDELIKEDEEEEKARRRELARNVARDIVRKLVAGMLPPNNTEAWRKVEKEEKVAMEAINILTREIKRGEIRGTKAMAGGFLMLFAGCFKNMNNHRMYKNRQESRSIAAFTLLLLLIGVIFVVLPKPKIKRSNP